MAHASSTRKLTPIIHGLAALCWGAVPIWFYASERLHSYLKGPFQTYALIGGLGLVVLGLFNILTASDDTDCGHDHCDHDHGHEGHDHEHDHTHDDQNPLLTVALMILPVLFAVVMTQDTYSEAALRRKGAFKDSRDSMAAYFENLPPFTLETLQKNTPQNEAGDYLLEITQIYWSSGDDEVMAVFDGIPIEIKGRLMAEDKEKNPEGKRMRLYQLFMNCCAADATVLGLPIEFEGSLPDLAPHSWVQLNATVAYALEDGRPTAYLKVRALAPTKDPAQGRNPFSFR